MKITAVILHYYSVRTENIPRIVKDLRNNSRPPDEIIIFNNNPEVVYSGDGTVINSGKNYGGRARFLIALLEPSDYYYFLDDDVAPGKDAIKNFLKYADNNNCCYGYWGKIINPKAGSCYQSGNEFYGNHIKKPQEVDLIVGEGGFFVSFSALKNMIKTEEKFLKEGFIFGREEDLILSMSNRPFVIPANKDEYYSRLPTKGVGYCRTPGHYELRNKMARKLYPIRRQMDSLSVSDELKVEIKKEDKGEDKKNDYKPL